MTSPSDRPTPPTGSKLPIWLSIVIPGAGQVYLQKRWRGIAIFVMTAVLAFLIQWSLDNFKIGLWEFGQFTTSWLWAMLIGFWAWNVFDAYRLTQSRSAGRWLAFLLPLVIIYVIAWQVTDVKLDRLVTRFSDAQIVFRAILNPDLFERDKSLVVAQTQFDVPCDQPVPQSPATLPRITVEPQCGDVGAAITLHGEGFAPGAEGRIYWLYDLDGSNEAQVREGGSPVPALVGADGQFESTFNVPAFAGAASAAPQQLIQVRFEEEVGPLRASDTFGDIIGKTVNGVFVPGQIFATLALGLLATILSTLFAVPLSFFAAHNVMERVPGGMAIYYVMRTILNVVRAVDTIVWGLLVIVWVGLGNLAGLIALTIHSTAALGKLFSEEVEHIDHGPIEALTATGANLLQVVRYGIIPQIYSPFLAYTLLRWDINMRSATVVGFVAGGGIGVFVVETIRKGGYREYAAALWAIAVVIIVVDWISGKWRQRIAEGDTKIVSEPPRPWYKSPRKLIYTFLLLAIVAGCLGILQMDFGKMFEPSPTFGTRLVEFVTIDLGQNVLDSVLKQMLITVFQALIATTFGALVAIPFSFLGARNLMSRTRLSRAIYYVVRSIFNIFRSIEALLYVAIFVFWVGIGAFAGALALTITTFALIGKLFSEAIENIDTGPLEAITATGATRLQAIVYGILPQIVPPFVSYAIYQWDINIRISTIIGFAGGGGIGLLLATFFGQLQYHKAGTAVLLIVLVVVAMDFASAKIRQKLV
jgi:phosphonate transport system permease protein